MCISTFVKAWQAFYRKRQVTLIEILQRRVLAQWNRGGRIEKRNVTASIPDARPILRVFKQLCCSNIHLEMSFLTSASKFPKWCYSLPLFISSTPLCKERCLWAEYSSFPLYHATPTWTHTPHQGGGQIRQSLLHYLKYDIFICSSSQSPEI